MARKGALYPNAAAIIAKQLTGPVERAATAYADKLSDNLAAGSRSGIQYPSLPRQSSAPGEYPQSQTGSLKDSVGTSPTNNKLVWSAGFFGEDKAKLLSLEYGSRNMAERAPLYKTSQDNDTRARMLAAAKRR